MQKNPVVVSNHERGRAQAQGMLSENPEEEEDQESCSHRVRVKPLLERRHSQPGEKLQGWLKSMTETVPFRRGKGLGGTRVAVG